MMLRWISLDPPPSDIPWRHSVWSPSFAPGVGSRLPAGHTTASSPASSRPISAPRMTLSAANSFMSEPAGGGMAPVRIAWVSRTVIWRCTTLRTKASATSCRTCGSPCISRARTTSRSGLSSSSAS